jgi:hypothetical protein
MSIIVPQASPPANFYVSKSIRGANGVQKEIFGHYLPNYLPSEVSNELTTPYSFPNGTTYFDASSITENHEVVCIGYVSPNQIPSATTYTISWYRRRDGACVFAHSPISISDPPTGQVYDRGFSIAAWIGWCAENLNLGTYPTYREIQENGDYYAIIGASGGENFSKTIEFSVAGMPPSTVARNIGTNQFDWIVNLSEYFDTQSYIRVGICKEPFTSGQTEEPTGIVSFVNAPSSNRGAAASGTAYEPVVTAYGFAQTVDGRYWSTGSFYVGMNVRPYNWEWYAPKVSDQDYLVSAVEWNDFCTRINQFLFYKGKPLVYDFVTANPNDSFFYHMFNKARNAINQMKTTSVPTVVSNGEVYAWYFNTLRDDLNSIT